MAAFLTANLHFNTLRECRALWMTTLRGSRAGNVSREGAGFKTRERTWPESSRGLLGARRRCRQHHCSFIALLLSNSVGVNGEAQDFYNQSGMAVEFRWRCEGGSVSVNFQVSSFCNYSSILPHLNFDDSPFCSFYSISSSPPLIGLS